VADRPNSTPQFNWLGEQFALIDVPGGTGFQADGARALALADLAIVVVDPDPARAPLAAPMLRLLDELGLPHLVFVNRIDAARGSVGALLEALQPLSVSPLIARQVPITSGDKVTGFVDIASSAPSTIAPASLPNRSQCRPSSTRSRRRPVPTSRTARRS
jgi:elongation factor G